MNDDTTLPKDDDLDPEEIDLKAPVMGDDDLDGGDTESLDALADEEDEEEDEFNDPDEM